MTTLSETLYRSWDYMCHHLVGRSLPITHIEPGLLSHRLEASDKPLRTTEGVVRQVSMTYDYEDYKSDFPN